MGCCKGEKNVNKTITVELIFKREELLYDIKNTSFVEADIMNDDEEHSRHQVFDIGEFGNVNRVTRILNLAYTECIEILFPYTKTEVIDGFKADDILTESEDYVIVLTLPISFSQTTVNLLKNLIHEYFVSRVLADWFSITKPKSQENWEDKIGTIKSKMKNLLASRRGKINRPMKPF